MGGHCIILSTEESKQTLIYDCGEVQVPLMFLLLHSPFKMRP